MSAPADNVRPRLAGKARLKWDTVREKHLLLFPEGVLVLNPTAHAVLALCDGQRTVADIIQTLAAQYANDALAGDVRDLLEKLADKGLVTLEGAS
jgi:pyrroloquinoline quinone biosynthesis protein D